MKKALLFLLLTVSVICQIPNPVNAEKTIRFTTVINPGVLSSEILDGEGQLVDTPSLDIGDVGSASSCLYQITALKDTLGDESQRIYIDNRAAANGGWTLTIASVGGEKSQWEGQDGHVMDFDDPGRDGLGCNDSDADGAGGLLSIDPSHAQLVSLCPTCDSRNVLLGSEKLLTFADGHSLTVLRADTPAGNWYLTGIDVTQTVPSGQAADLYTLDLVLTSTAS